MANTLRFEIIGESESGQAAFRKVSTAADETHSHMSKVRNIMAGVFAGNVLTAGAEKVVGFLKESVNAAVEDQRAEAMLTNTLHDVAGATNEQTEAVKKRLLADGEHLGIMQDQMMPAFQKLVMVTHSTTQATGLLTLTENLAAAKHMQLADAAGQVAKMTMGSNRVFKEFGIQVQANTTAIQGVQKAQEHLVYVQQEVANGAIAGKKAQQELAKAHDAVTQAQFKARFAIQSVNEGLEKVAKMTKGDAAAAADTYAGRLAQMHVRFHDLQILIGNAVLPQLTALMGFIMQKAVPAFQAMGRWVQQNQAWLVPLAAAIVGIITVVKIWTLAQAALDAVMAANPVMLVVAAIVGLIAVIVVAYNKVKWFHDLVNVAFHAIAATVEFVVNFIKQHWLLMLNIMTGGLAAPVAFIIRNWGSIQNGFGSMVNWIRNAWNSVVSFFGGTVSAIGGVFGRIGSAIGSAFSKAFGAVSAAFRGMINWIIGGINSVIDAANNVVGVASLGFASIPHVPRLAHGGIVMPRPGGTLAQIAEAGYPEAVIPLDGKHSLGGGSLSLSITVNGFVGGDQDIAREVKRILLKDARTSGNPALAGLLR